MILDLQGVPMRRGDRCGVPVLQAYFGQHRVNAAVLVCDTEGEDPVHVTSQLAAAAPRGLPGVPTVVVGVAHPCLEAWLLADAGARTARAAELKDRLAALDPSTRGREGKCAWARQRTSLASLHQHFPEYAAIVESLTGLPRT